MVPNKVKLTHAHFSNQIAYSLFTDDCLIFGPSTTQVQSVITLLQQTFLLKDEGKVKDFLGICISWDPQNGTITLMQPGLVNSVLHDLGLLSHEATQCS